MFINTTLAQDTLSTGLVDPECDSEIERYLSPGAFLLPSTNVTLPESCDLANFIPYIADQGKQGACTAFSVASALTILNNQKNGKEFDGSLMDLRYLYSPAFIFNVAKSRYPVPRSENCLDGISFIDAFLVVREFGITNWLDFPYNGSGNNGCASSNYPTTKIIHKASTNKILTFQRPDLNLRLLKYLLSSKPGYPICIATKIDNNYYEAVHQKENHGLWTIKGTPLTSNSRHAMLIVGYDDRKKCFKVLDSRGPNLGDGGFLWLSYDFLLNGVIYDAYICSYDNKLLASQRQLGNAGENQALQTKTDTYFFGNSYRVFNGIGISCLSIDKRNGSSKFQIYNGFTNEIIIPEFGIQLNQERLISFGLSKISIAIKKFGREESVSFNATTPGTDNRSAVWVTIKWASNGSVEEFSYEHENESSIKALAKKYIDSGWEKGDERYLITQKNVYLDERRLKSNDSLVVLNPKRISEEYDKYITKTGRDSIIVSSWVALGLIDDIYPDFIKNFPSINQHMERLYLQKISAYREISNSAYLDTLNKYQEWPNIDIKLRKRTYAYSQLIVLDEFKLQLILSPGLPSVEIDSLSNGMVRQDPWMKIKMKLSRSNPQVVDVTVNSSLPLYGYVSREKYYSGKRSRRLQKRFSKSKIK